AIALAGPSERAIRSVVALEAAVGVALVFLLGAARYGTAVGACGAALLATADRYYVYARYIETDMLLTLLIVAAFLWLQPGWLYGWGACLGACLLTKQVVGALPLVLPALDLLGRRPPPRRRLLGALGLALALALPWHLFEWSQHGARFWDTFLLRNIGLRARDPM